MVEFRKYFSNFMISQSTCLNEWVRKLSPFYAPKVCLSGHQLNSKIILNSHISMRINYPIYAGIFKAFLDFHLN